MNRLTARFAMALSLLLAALLLTLTCAAAEETSYSYNEYSWDESTGTLKTNVMSKKLSEMMPIDVIDSWHLGGTSSDPYFYYVAVPSDLDLTYVPVGYICVQGNVSILLLCNVYSEIGEIEVYLEEGSILNMYSLSSENFGISHTYYCMKAGSTLNLYRIETAATFTSNSAASRPTVNCYMGYNCYSGANVANIKDTILNIYGPSRTGLLSLDNSTVSHNNDTTFGIDRPSEYEGVVSLTNHSEMNICDGKIILKGERILYRDDENSTLNFCPRGENGYYGIFSSTTPSQDSLIGACKGKAPDELFEKINNSNVVSMVRMTAIGIDEAPQTYYVDESPRFAVNVLTEGVASGSFTVEYKQNGAYSTTPPTQAGTYDVRITRPMDDTYLPFEKEIPGGLVVAMRTITYTSPEPQTIDYDGEAHSLRVTVNSPADAAVIYTTGTGESIVYPSFTDAGDYTVNYTITKTNYQSESGTLRLTINPFAITCTAAGYTGVHDGTDHGVSAEVEVLVPTGLAAYDTDSTQRAKGITPGNVQPEDEGLLRQALSDYQGALDTYGGSFTEAEKQEVQAEMERIRSELEALERAAAVRKAIAALPDAVEPDDTNTAARILEAKAALDALTAHEKALVGDAPAAKLDSLTAMLTAYRITRGDGASVIEGQNTALSFTANGPLSKFTAVQVDGKTLDAKHYTAQSGSTIITLAADYVETLAAGEHTLTVRYTDGETRAHFTVTPMKEDLPQTGDGSHLMIWLALLCMSCAGLWCLNRRRV